MRGVCSFVAVSLLAAVAPVISLRPDPPGGSQRFPGWPREWQGKPLKQIPLSEREERFASGFPGRIARFTDGQRQFVIRWVTRSTRRLHPATDCFRGSGYAVRPLPLQSDAEGRRWGCFEAKKSRQPLEVCERISDEFDGAWTDVSAWWWAATMGRSKGPWWAVTVVTPMAPSRADPKLSSAIWQSAGQVVRPNQFQEGHHR